MNCAWRPEMLCGVTGWPDLSRSPRARFRSGEPSGWPGRKSTMSHDEPAPRASPICSAGKRPVLTSDDFPIPDDPRTTRKRVAASRSSIASMQSSRPKKMSLSSARNDRSPGYGARSPTAEFPAELLDSVHGEQLFGAEDAHVAGGKARLLARRLRRRRVVERIIARRALDLRLLAHVHAEPVLHELDRSLAVKNDDRRGEPHRLDEVLLAVGLVVGQHVDIGVVQSRFPQLLGEVAVRLIRGDEQERFLGCRRRRRLAQFLQLRAHRLLELLQPDRLNMRAVEQLLRPIAQGGAVDLGVAPLENGERARPLLQAGEGAFVGALTARFDAFAPRRGPGCAPRCGP